MPLTLSHHNGKLIEDVHVESKHISIGDYRCMSEANSCSDGEMIEGLPVPNDTQQTMPLMRRYGRAVSSACENLFKDENNLDEWLFDFVFNMTLSPFFFSQALGSEDSIGPCELSN